MFILSEVADHDETPEKISAAMAAASGIPTLPAARLPVLWIEIERLRVGPGLAGVLTRGRGRGVSRIGSGAGRAMRTVGMGLPVLALTRWAPGFFGEIAYHARCSFHWVSGPCSGGSMVLLSAIMYDNRLCLVVLSLMER